MVRPLVSRSLCNHSYGASVVNTISSRRTIRALLASSILFGIYSPALADVPVPVPTRELTDENQVDLFRGVYVVDETVASVGGNEGLSYRRISRGNGFSSNFDSSLQLTGGTYVATVNGRSDSFTLSGGVYVPTEGNGSSLSYNSTTLIYTYVARDGTVVTFDKNRRASSRMRTLALSRPSFLRMDRERRSRMRMQIIAPNS